MNFLNIGPGEMMAILAIAILVIGPARMVTFARSIGRVIRRMRSISGEFLGSLQEELGETTEAAREAIGGLQADGADLTAEVDATKQVTDDALEDTGDKALKATGSMQEELSSFAREAHAALKDVSDSFTGLVKAEAEKPDTEDEENGEET